MNECLLARLLTMLEYRSNGRCPYGVCALYPLSPRYVVRAVRVANHEVLSMLSNARALIAQDGYGASLKDYQIRRIYVR